MQIMIGYPSMGSKGSTYKLDLRGIPIPRPKLKMSPCTTDISFTQNWLNGAVISSFSQESGKLENVMCTSI